MYFRNPWGGEQKLASFGHLDSMPYARRDDGCHARMQCQFLHLASVLAANHSVSPIAVGFVGLGTE